MALMGLFFYSMPVRLTLLNITKSLVNSRLAWVTGLLSKETASSGVCVGLVPREIQEFGFINGVEEEFPANQGLRIGLGLRLWVLADHKLRKGLRNMSNIFNQRHLCEY